MCVKILKVKVNCCVDSSLYNIPSSAKTETFEYAPVGSNISFALDMPDADLFTDLTLTISCDAERGTTW